MSPGALPAVAVAAPASETAKSAKITDAAAFERLLSAARPPGATAEAPALEAVPTVEGEMSEELLDALVSDLLDAPTPEVALPPVALTLAPAPLPAAIPTPVPLAVPAHAAPRVPTPPRTPTTAAAPTAASEELSGAVAKPAIPTIPDAVDTVFSAPDPTGWEPPATTPPAPAGSGDIAAPRTVQDAAMPAEMEPAPEVQVSTRIRADGPRTARLDVPMADGSTLRAEVSVDERSVDIRLHGSQETGVMALRDAQELRDGLTEQGLELREFEFQTGGDDAHQDGEGQQADPADSRPADFAPEYFDPLAEETLSVLAAANDGDPELRGAFVRRRM